MATRSAMDRPHWWEWSAIGFFGLVVVSFGGLVIWRSAYMNLRHTDFDVYAAAAWAVRNGHDVYEVTNEDGLHYCYPPTFAMLLTPLAEPPDQSRQPGYLPFGMSIAIWYVVSCVCLFVAVHLLANAAERSSNQAIPINSRRWWSLRLWPILFTLPGIGGTLSHGQVNLLLLLLLASSMAAAMNQRSLRAGLWLAGAVTLKVIPAFLVFAPMMRLDRRCLVGLMIGLLGLLVVVPAMILGPSQALATNAKFIDVMIHPSISTNHDATRALEMFHVLRTDNQSIQAVLHAWQHWGDPNAPPQPDSATRAVHWVIGFGLTAVTLGAVRRRRLKREQILLWLSSLIVVMLLVSPMAHLHYYCLTLPLVLALLHRAWEGQSGLWPGKKLAFMLALHVAGGAFPLIFGQYRNLGFAPLTTLPLWAAAVRSLWFERETAADVLTFMPMAERHRAA